MGFLFLFHLMHKDIQWCTVQRCQKYFKTSITNATCSCTFWFESACFGCAEPIWWWSKHKMMGILDKVIWQKKRNGEKNKLSQLRQISIQEQENGTGPKCVRFQIMHHIHLRFCKTGPVSVLYTLKLFSTYLVICNNILCTMPDLFSSFWNDDYTGKDTFS